MAFYDNLYSFENIVGYTGQLHNFPTVYFQSQQHNLVGHITQAHPFPQNVGRTDPLPLTGYRWENKPTPQGEVLMEYFNNIKFHTSRNKFIELGTSVRGNGADRFDMAAFAILAQSIRNCPHQKQMDVFSKRDIRKIAAARDAKDAVMAQLQQISSIGNLARARRGL